jgi:hypothetical protein
LSKTLRAAKKRLPSRQRDGLTTKHGGHAAESTRSHCAEILPFVFLKKNNALPVGRTAALTDAGFEKEDYV